MSKQRIAATAAGAMAGVMLLGMTASAAPDLKASPTNNTYYMNGQQVDLTAYKIAGNNYVKLRDVGELVDFGVEYDAGTGKVTIDPDSMYTPEVKQNPKKYTGKDAAPYKTVSLKESDANYYKELWAAELYNYKMIRNFPTLYVSAAWDACQAAGNQLEAMDVEKLTDTDKTKITAAKEAREAMEQQQLIPFSEEVLYIWGDNNMPTTTENVQEGFTKTSYDNSDFRPFLIPMLAADQSTAKGNLIVLSGGGNTTRSNPNEAYKVAPAFQKLGYNCFILQRRVEPYNNDDIVMDLQRAIRYMKDYAKKNNLGAQDVIAATGFSGGAGNICTLLEKYYGDITPDQFDKSYKPDAIDAISSDLDIALPIYSGRKLETENPKMPHIFTAVGEDDNLGGSFAGEGAFAMYAQMKTDERYANVSPELHIYGQNGHGFGAGNAGTSSMLWIRSADMYMQKVMGKAEIKFTGEIPAEFTLTQTVDVTWFPIGDHVDVNVYVNSDMSKFLFTFFGWGDNIQVMGILINGHVADVTYDSVGYFGGDAPKIFELCDPNAWVPVK